MTEQLPKDTCLEYGLSIEIPRITDEQAVIDELLDLDDKDILELGCGRAELTRAIARAGTNRRLVALEVDRIQHARNLEGEAPPNVRFALGGAEDIPAADCSFDVVFLFKSLHHVPEALMDQALAEVARVLRPGGVAYVSEPLFRGDFNDVLRMFHDEGDVRRLAFDALVRALRSGPLELVSQTFFRAPRRFADFAEFDDRILRVTHQSYELTDELLARVRAAFARHEGEDGVCFLQPVRVDLLRRPGD